VIAQVVDRETRDPDFFGATADRVDRLVPALEHALRLDGLDVSRKRANRGFAHFTISDNTGGLTELDLGVDARIREAESGPLGPMLALEELAADKTLALFGRAQARDFIDVAALADRFGFDQLCEPAAEKDPGFSPPYSSTCSDPSTASPQTTSTSTPSSISASPQQYRAGATTSQADTS